jgi:hypothetical protein
VFAVDADRLCAVLAQDAQMQHVQMTKHFNELMLEKEAELRHWKQQAALAKGGDAEELKYSPSDSPYVAVL